MRPYIDPPTTRPASDPTAFDLWLSRTLKDAYERVLHEPMPTDILRALPPATPQD